MTGAFSLGAWFLGAAALAAGLFLLQRLRVRHRPVVVVSTLFWQEALQEARARVLVQRFRHLFTYFAPAHNRTSDLDGDRRSKINGS